MRRSFNQSNHPPLFATVPHYPPISDRMRSASVSIVGLETIMPRSGRPSTANPEYSSVMIPSAGWRRRLVPSPCRRTSLLRQSDANSGLRAQDCSIGLYRRGPKLLVGHACQRYSASIPVGSRKACSGFALPRDRRARSRSALLLKSLAEGSTSQRIKPMCSLAG